MDYRSLADIEPDHVLFAVLVGHRQAEADIIGRFPVAETYNLGRLDSLGGHYLRIKIADFRKLAFVTIAIKLS